ncbi:serine/threonine protein kinase [Halostreptopolyspora alba]|uniref:Protein kinase domain-containing protein n=1 Tax=Halostreptopolyspora alba TaxID=2487137 RepID=A0A3N0E6L8_9ACTN|nr:hypothetical protein EFW17_15980 [Nocardiopsaceae bacterium YIM 96095]
MGAYRIVGLVCRDGAAVTYVGSTKEGRRVAVRTVADERAVTPDLRSRLDHRIILVRGISATCLVPVIDADPTAERPWYATPLVSGATLQDHVSAHGPLGADQVRVLALGLAEAIDAAHTAGWTFASLTTSDIVLAPAGPALLDPALTRLLGGHATAARDDTPENAPPSTDVAEPPDTAADVHAWATVVTFAATGRPPGPEDGATGGGLAPQLAEVVTHALHDDPRERPDAETLFRQVAQPLNDPAQAGAADTFVPRAVERYWSAPEGSATTAWTPLHTEKSQPRLRPKVAVAGVLVLVAGLATVYAAGGLTLGSGDVTDHETNARLIEEAGCDDCTTPVHVVPGLEHQGEDARLVLTNATTDQGEFGAEEQVAVYLIRNRDDEILAHNMSGEPTGMTISPELEFDDLWSIDDSGNFYLLTGGPGDDETQRVAWLNQDDPRSVENFSAHGVQTAWQESLEATDLDGDQTFEVAADAGVRTFPPEPTNVRFYYKYHREDHMFLPWKCTDSQGATVAEEDLYPMSEEPCSDYGQQEEVPWDY